MSKARKSTNGGDPAAKVYSKGDIVLAKIKGFPSWPGQVVDPDEVPGHVKKEKPPKGYRVCVQFFPEGDYSWSIPRDVSALTSDDIDKYLADTSKKQGELRTAYQTAQSPEAWRKQQAENERLRQEEAEAINKAQEMAEEDELASEPEAGGGKKRKRKEAKPKESPEESKKRKKAKLNDLAKKRKDEKTADPNIESEDESAAPPPSTTVKATKSAKKATEESQDPGSKQAMKWRSDLQKLFFGKNADPAASDMPGADEIFTSMEAFEMQQDWLASSKLYKILKNLQRADTKVPRDDEFKFRERANALMEKWYAKTEQNGAPKSAADAEGEASTAADDSKIEADAAGDDDAPAANGTTNGMDVDKADDEDAGAEAAETVDASEDAAGEPEVTED